MTWTKKPPVASMLVDLLTLQVHAEHGKLVEKLRRAEAQLATLGAPVDQLAAARRALQQRPLPEIRRGRLVEVPGRRLRHLVVKESGES